MTDKKLVLSTNGGRNFETGGGFAAVKNISRGIRDFKTGAGFAADKSFVRVDSNFETSDGVTAIRNFGGSTDSGFKTVKRISRGGRNFETGGFAAVKNILRGGFAAGKNFSRGASDFETGGGISERHEEG